MVVGDVRVAAAVRYPSRMASSRPPSDDAGPAKRRRPSKSSGPAKAERASSPADGAQPDGEIEAASAKRRPRGRQVVMGLVGVGFAATDGHPRLTKGDDFVLFGGSEATHAQLQDLTIRLTERLKLKGKRIAGADMREIRDIVQDLRNE